MAIPVRPPLAQPGETRTIVVWTKGVGDPVSAGETICEVETDKATVEIESQTGGVLVAQLFKVGEEIPEDGPIALVGDDSEIGTKVTGDAIMPAGSSSLAQSPGDSAAEPASVTESESVVSRPAAVVPPAARRRVAVSPRARKRSDELSVSIDGLAGTGPGGRIIERDVLAAASKSVPGVAHPSGALAEASDDKVIPVRGARQLVADRMHASLRDTAQLTMTSYADATRLLELRAAFKGADSKFQVSCITLNDLILYAVARTLPEHPEINATCRNGDGGLEVVRSAVAHLAFAVDTPRVLMVPVIRDVGRLRVRELSACAADLAERCRERTITPGELSGGTFTVSNLGSFGVESFTPILNSPQVAILGVGAVKWRSVDEQLVQQQIALSLTIDHRLIDGASAARFLQTLCMRLAELDVLLAL